MNTVSLALVKHAREMMRHYALMWAAVHKTLLTTPGLDDGQKTALRALRRKHLACAASYREDAAFHAAEAHRTAQWAGIETPV